MTLLEKINALSANGGRNFTPKRVTFVILSLLMALSEVKAKVGKSLLLQDLTKKLNGKVMKFTNLFENDVIDGDRITHRELMFMGEKTSGRYQITINGKYLNVRRETAGVTTTLYTNLDTHNEVSIIQIDAVGGARYYIEGKIKEFGCGANDITTLDVSKCTALTDLSCSQNQLTTLDVSKCTELTYLSCKQNQLTTLDVSKCTALTDLSCSQNQLTTLDVSKCTELTYLECYNNQLTTLDVSNCTALTFISCFENQLTTLDVSKCKALTKLICYQNQLTTLDVSKCKALTKLFCYQNQLTTLDVSECIELTELRCYRNQLTTLDVSKCTALTFISCFENQLTTLDVTKCTALNEFYCYQNQLTTLDVTKCTALNEFYCYQNQLTTLDVTKCTALTILVTFGNAKGLPVVLSDNTTGLTFGYAWVSAEGMTAQDIEPMLLALPNATNSAIYIVDEVGDVFNELEDARAIAESKGWVVDRNNPFNA